MVGPRSPCKLLAFRTQAWKCRDLDSVFALPRIPASVMYPWLVPVRGKRAAHPTYRPSPSFRFYHDYSPCFP